MIHKTAIGIKVRVKRQLGTVKLPKCNVQHLFFKKSKSTLNVSALLNLNKLGKKWASLGRQNFRWAKRFVKKLA